MKYHKPEGRQLSEASRRPEDYWDNDFMHWLMSSEYDAEPVSDS